MTSEHPTPGSNTNPTELVAAAGTPPADRRIRADVCEALTARITIPEIKQRLGIGRQKVYQLLESGEIPAIRLGKLWLVTRHVYQQWERSCGTRTNSEEQVQ